METKTTNFLTEQSKALINNLIHTLQSLKDEQLTDSDTMIVTKQLNNLVNELNASLYSKESISAGSRISVLLPHAYPSVKETITNNFLSTASAPIAQEATKDIVEKNEEKETAEVTEEPTSQENLVKDEKQIIPEVKEITEDKTPDVVVIAPPAEKEEGPIEETESVVVELPKEEVLEIVEEPQPEIVEEKIENSAPIEENTKKEEKEPEAGNYFSLWETFASNDVPTLLHQDGVEPEKKEDKPSNTSDLTPIKDLKKSISINDRYLFINELFRGDESTYERSIKTINGFNIYQEASFWIERELKVKLGWQEKDPTVKDFMELVKRRFL